MSADEDLSNELLALAGDGEADHPRKKRRQSGADRNGSAKRRRPNDTTDDDLESEDGGGGPVDPYPLEGKYIDEEDRERLMDMNELDREEILAQRLEEQQRYLDSVKLERMHKIATGQATSDDDDAVSKAAKRKHTAPGTSRTKARKLDELKAKRAAHAAKTSRREESRRALSDSGSGSDMEESDEEEEGQVTRWDEEEDKRHESPAKAQEKIEKADLERIRLTRDTIEKWCYLPNFQELVKGCWVRFLIGPDKEGQPVYRVCQIIGLTEESPRTYNIQNTAFNQQAILKHSTNEKAFPLDRVSNSPFTDREFDRLVAQCAQDKVKLPTKREIALKAAALEEQRNHIFTETEISAMIARKHKITGKGNANLTYAEKSRLHQERALAFARRDLVEVQKLDELIRAQESASPGPRETEDTLAKVNERNRRANLERIRKAEAAEAEERRRQGGLRPPVVRKLHSTGNTPVLGPKDGSQESIQPLALDGGGLLTPGAVTPARSQSPSPKKPARIESKLATSIDLDLGDF